MNPWDNDPVVNPFDEALAAEGVTGKVADIARSIYMQESGGGRNTKTSNAGAVGGMQVIPGTFAQVADKGWDINDPIANARAGIRYVKQGFEASGGDPALTGAFYYGGPGGLEKARRGVAVSDPRNPGAPTTLQYGQQVAARLPKERGVVQRAVEAVVPSAQAAAPGGNPWDNDPIVEATPPAAAEPPGFFGAAAESSKQLGLGALRGAAGIGTTLLAPTDYIADKMAGRPGGTANRERRSSINQFAEENADTGSLIYQAGKLGTEIAGTAGVGGTLAAPVRAVAPRLANALASGGMTVGPGGGQVANILTRMAGGATTGAASAGLVNPDDAITGAVVGGTMPGATKIAGAAGNAIGRTVRGPQVPANTLAAAAAGRSAGYVIPPTQARPTLTNRLLEGMSGKITTAQNASARNQEVTNRLAREGVNVAELTPDAIAAARTQANGAYDALGKAGSFSTDDAFREALGKVGASSKQLRADFPEVVSKDIDGLVESFASKDTFDAQSAIEAMKRLRASASANRAAFSDPEKQALGRVQNKVSDALENLVDRNLEKSGQADLLAAFRDARQRLAKLYDVEKALNPASGNVDAAKLAAKLKKGRPLTGELRQVAEFGSSFPKAVQTPERMGSLPQSSPLDWHAAGATSLVAGNPLPMLGVAVRPGARALALSPLVQNRLGRQPQPNRLMQLAGEPDLAQLFYRGAPVAASDR